MSLTVGEETGKKALVLLDSINLSLETAGFKVQYNNLLAHIVRVPR